ncbi:MAG: Small GTP-binding domain protein [Promethearchaeota archaeon]|nr:MAG: Small GTP-binding domain protein [Candidatus Lokiarchaeota archaeon]
MASVIDEIEEEAFSKTADEVDYHDFYKYRISYITNKELRLLFLFVTGLTDNFEDIEKELKKCKKEFLNLFDDILQHKFDKKTFEVFDPTVDAIHRNLRPKISLVGFSGVGKTTITRLIKAEEIPMQHIPTITGDIATIKIGKLHFHLWDFAGQEQFSYLWSNFIKGSDAVLLITDSTLENVEKSKFFLELIKEQAPDAHSAVIANKQDLEQALKPDKLEDILGLKAYSMIAIDPDNRDKMIKIIADVLEMNTQISPLLKPLLERDEKMRAAQNALENADFAKAAELFEEISDLCLDLGDDSLSQEFYKKSKKIKAQLSGLKGGEKEKPKEIEKEVEKEKIKEPELAEFEEAEKPDEKVEKVAKKVEKPSIPKVKPLPTLNESEAKTEPEKPISKPEEKVEAKTETATSEGQTTAPSGDFGLKLNPEDFMIKQKPKKVGSVPKDAKRKLKTSAYGHVVNPQRSEASTTKKPKKPPKVEKTPEEEKKETPAKPESKIEPESVRPSESETMSEPPKQAESPPTTIPKMQNNVSTETSKQQKEELKKELMDLKIKKARISKMGLDFEMQELSGEITAEELHEKKARLESLEKNIQDQIKDLEAILNG